MSKFLVNLKKSYVYDICRSINKNVIKWRWFPVIVFVLCAILIFLYTSYKIEPAGSYDSKFILKKINQISLALIAGGTFTAIIKVFQFNNVFKTEIKEVVNEFFEEKKVLFEENKVLQQELKAVIIDEDIHLEKSRLHRDNIFINNLDKYSFRFLRQILKLMVIRIFPSNFNELLGGGFSEILATRLHNELAIGRVNNYIQKKLEIKYAIEPYKDDNRYILLEQETSSYLLKARDDIKFKRAYSNLIPNEHLDEERLVEVEYFKIDNVEYKDEFIHSVREKKIKGLYKHTEKRMDITIDIKDKKEVKFESKTRYLLSLDSFLHWEYRYAVYTKGVKVTVKCDPKYIATILEFAQKEKMEGVEEEMIHKYNTDAIYLPEDKLMLAIHVKRS